MKRTGLFSMAKKRHGWIQTAAQGTCVMAQGLKFRRFSLRCIAWHSPSQRIQNTEVLKLRLGKKCAKFSLTAKCLQTEKMISQSAPTFFLPATFIQICFQKRNGRFALTLHSRSFGCRGAVFLQF